MPESKQLYTQGHLYTVPVQISNGNFYRVYHLYESGADRPFPLGEQRYNSMWHTRFNWNSTLQHVLLHLQMCHFRNAVLAWNYLQTLFHCCECEERYICKHWSVTNLIGVTDFNKLLFINRTYFECINYLVLNFTTTVYDKGAGVAQSV
jgi:hypothetical protein